MYLPELADLILKNQDKIIDGGKLDFRGMMIGNGAMNMDMFWRTKVPIAFFDQHYFFGPEVKGLLKTCNFDASDEHNPSCLMGLKLADEVNYSLFRQLLGLMLIILSVFATTCLNSTECPRKEDIVTLLFIAKDLFRFKTMSQTATLMIQVCSSSSMTRQFKSNYMFSPLTGLLVVIRFGTFILLAPPLFLFSRASRRQGLR